MELVFNSLYKCTLCPRRCQANRITPAKAYCKAGVGFEIASISVHKGEEPVISGDKGICNVFFSHCNLRCIFCQNYQISGKNCNIYAPQRNLRDIADTISGILDTGIESLGFVSPSHMIPQMKAIIEEVHNRGYKPIIVFNTNAYDLPETLRELEGIVDVYLPDFKYADANLAGRLSDAPEYPEIAIRAIKEMYRQKGNVLRMNENGIAENGMIVRHLVLPGEVENSKSALHLLAEEVSENISISLMSQYHPIPGLSKNPSLNRKLHETEYLEVVKEMETLGFTKGWIQEFESADFYLPDFKLDSPFEGMMPEK